MFGFLSPDSPETQPRLCCGWVFLQAVPGAPGLCVALPGHRVGGWGVLYPQGPRSSCDPTEPAPMGVTHHLGPAPQHRTHPLPALSTLSPACPCRPGLLQRRRKQGGRDEGERKAKGGEGTLILSNLKV